MKLTVVRMGLLDYREALELQEKLQQLRLDNKISDMLLLLEHNNVITLGRRGKYSNIFIPEREREKLNVPVYEVTRGGDVTYHGPGQLVGYLIFDLKSHHRDAKKFVWNIQEVFIRFLKEFYDIESCRDDKTYTGVWAGNDKITAIGISVRRDVTMHGFSFNINTNLDHYRWINPCGISDKGVTSLERLTAQKQDFNLVVEKIIPLFGEIFNMDIEIIAKSDLENLLK